MAKFPATLNCDHRVTLVNLMGRVPVGGGSVVIGAAEDVDLRNLAGAIDYYAGLPGGCGSAPPPVGCGADALHTTIPWGDGNRYATQDIGPFAVNDWCIAFTVPADITQPFTKMGNGSGAEFNGEPWMRFMTLSKTPCDFRPVDPTGANGPLALSTGKQVTIFFSVISGPSDWPALTPGETYYFNMRNEMPVPAGKNLAAGFSISFPANPG